jgi:hypothetical protein
MKAFKYCLKDDPMRFYIAAFVSLLVALPAAAQPWYARGDFNGWSLDNPLVVDPANPTHYTAKITGLVDNNPYLWKIAEDDYAPEMPGTGPGHEGRVYANALGEIDFHLWDNSNPNDGWFPNNVRRVGYNDHQQFDWEIVGSFNGWSGTHDPNFALMDMGNGLHRGTFTFNAGIYNFKFRGVEANLANAWDTSIGATFDNAAADNTFAVAANGDPWTFELDLPNGRFRYFTEAAPPGPDGDYNENGTVDAADYVVWRNDPDSHGGNPAGYNTWRANFGASNAVTWLANSPQLEAQQLVDVGSGKYELNLTGLTPLSDYEFRILRSDASAIVPSNNVKVRANAAGEIGLTLHELTGASWGDGWSPANTHRVGYDDHNEFDWDIMGSFNGWSTPLVQLTDQGNGLHTGSFTIDTPGSYDFKFRQAGDWNTSIGADFGNNAPNATLTSTAASQVWNFELDLPNGRWRAYPGAAARGAAVPEPGALVLALVAALMLCATPCRPSVGIGAGTRKKIAYMTGVTINDKNAANVSPNMMHTAIASKNGSFSNGIIPSTVVITTMHTGRILAVPPSRSAW